jgi:pseudaminic acid synthase
MFRELEKCFIIAEISANHGQKLDRAIKLISEAKKCGADAVKFQTYTPDTMTIDCDGPSFRVDHPEWGGQSFYELYKKACTPWAWFEHLKKVADEEGIMFLSTVFDRTSVDFLEKIGIEAHKIASFEIVDIPLIEYTASKNKPLILSAGIATLGEIEDAVETAKENGAEEISVLKCVSGYPASPSDMNLRVIPELIRKFDLPVGLSDHTMGTAVPVASISLGVKIIEKHFTLTRELKTPDSFFSLEPAEFSELVRNVRVAEEALGTEVYRLTPGQKRGRKFKRSLYAVKDIKKGEKFSVHNIRCIRPGEGLEPRYLKTILGRKALRDIRKGTPLKLSHAA